jgi:purine-nucleoside phosphorylase
MNKPDNDVILKPRAIKDFVWEQIIYIPLDDSSLPLLRVIKKKAIKEKETIFGNLYLLEDKIVLYKCLGAPSAVLSLEPLIVSGAKEITILGFCGSLNRNFRIMDAVSISKAFSEEGTSRHYFPRKTIFDPSPALKAKIETVLHSSKLPFLSGSLVSTDAPYRETRAWLKEKQKRGIDVVDMETSAVFALAKFYGIQAAALTIISDELWSGVWSEGFRTPEFKEKIKDYFIPFIDKNW